MLFRDIILVKGSVSCQHIILNRLDAALQLAGLAYCRFRPVFSMLLHLILTLLASIHDPFPIGNLTRHLCQVKSCMFYLLITREMSILSRQTPIETPDESGMRTSNGLVNG